ncbi:MAG: hypothetical protein AUK44_05590 [Porphyromonadaceae bacterium CG2_30_38_12]|nr:MAG: hypothetical protein AUK44_05590 [Porphyromonadaceae bacterium CG2_30_38_12]
MKKNKMPNKMLNKNQSKFNTTLLLLGRFVLGAVFVFSGFVKAIDPLGSTYKFQDYFAAFGGAFYGLTDYAFFLAIALSTIELSIGLNFLTGVHVRITAWVALGFMLVMTPITLYIALTNPVSDCGCFGDALVITNWQTFYKNIFLLALVISLLFTTKHLIVFLSKRASSILTVLFVIVGVSISIYAYNHLMPIDFLPYKVGVHIPDAMAMPKDAAVDVYETTFIYEKNGSQKEFTLDNYPANDSTWKFIDQKTTLIKEGYKPPIHNFTIFNKYNDDITANVLSYEGYTYLLIMYDLQKTSSEGAQAGETFYKKIKNKHLQFMALTASSDNEIAAFTDRNKLSFEFFKADPITLKTMIRANPGLMLVKNGTIIGKWHWKDF